MRLAAWAALAACGWQQGRAVCDVNLSSVELIRSRGYDLTGQTHVITGGDAGIGYGIALALAEANARVVFLGHDLEKTAVAMRNITERTGNGKLSSIPVNLMSLASVKSAVAALLKSTEQIDAVICDAGLTNPLSEPSTTVDGFEPCVEIEYISHFYLVELLLPELRKTRGRVVHTSSIGTDSYFVCKDRGLPGDCLTIDMLSTTVRQPNTASNGNIFLALWMKTLHARILAHREANAGVSAYSFHPGVVATANMDAFYEKYGGKAAFLHMCEDSSTSPDMMIAGQVEACQKNPAWKELVQECPVWPWYACLCRGPDDVVKSCPLDAEQGGMTGAYLAAAPKEELGHINGAMTLACDYNPVLYGDPYVEMVGKIGATAALEFLERFYRLSLSWIQEDSQLEAVNI